MLMGCGYLLFMLFSHWWIVVLRYSILYADGLWLFAMLYVDGLCLCAVHLWWCHGCVQILYCWYRLCLWANGTCWWTLLAVLGLYMLYAGVLWLWAMLYADGLWCVLCCILMNYSCLLCSQRDCGCVQLFMMMYCWWLCMKECDAGRLWFCALLYAGVLWLWAMLYADGLWCVLCCILMNYSCSLCSQMDCGCVQLFMMMYLLVVVYERMWCW